MYKLKNHKGFTLIELLIVIAIIGILATLLIIALQGARVRAAKAKTMENLNQVSKALELHRNDDTGDQYPAIIKDAVDESGQQLLKGDITDGAGSLLHYCHNLNRNKYFIYGQYKDAANAYYSVKDGEQDFQNDQPLSIPSGYDGGADCR